MPTTPDPEHVILVAFTVEAPAVMTAHHRLQAALAAADTIDPSTSRNGITSWWVAEDVRDDGSDCDSAVFVHKGMQPLAVKLLHKAGVTGPHNLRPPAA
jgi:hypothetical protein